MTTIAKLNQVVTLINTFSVKPGQQDALVRILDEATEEVMRHIDGFVSANIHKSLDGKYVANYAQWRDEAAFRAMLTDERAKEHMGRAAALAEKFEPILYTVSAIHEIT
ncbi:MAG TPA: antibiotic biosynthesis monooxygenase family protein [Polyangiales bacterium]|nr:antibiotic biosynthesis monooxygenase family protein [Polyangiales bacterium]